MFLLIKQAHLYAPEDHGIKDVLVAGGLIAKIGERIDPIPALDMEVIEAEGRILTPGWIDLHVHLMGGGGEAGFWSRTPEIVLSRIVSAGVTTVVGCLGTDDVSRRPEGLLAKAMQLDEEGISTYIYTGSYQFPPATVTGSVRKDIALIPKVIGVGEVAISDHRSSQPSYEEFRRLAAEARVGGMIGGKAGLLHLHVGDGARGLEFLFRAVEETELPIAQFLPTHVSRTPQLLEQAIRFAQLGGNIDLTAAPGKLDFETSIDQALEMARAAGVSYDQITISSDSNGSLPLFDDRGHLLRLAIADIESLHQEVKDLVKSGHPLDQVLKTVTVNPAGRVGIADRKGSIEEGKDADLVLFDDQFDVHTVMAKGRVMVAEGQVQVRGTFEARDEPRA